LETLGRISGVMHLDTAGLFSDEDVRLAVGQRLPAGVIANVKYGAVILAGVLPQGANADQLTTAVKSVAGVRAVYPSFANHSSSL
jgi:hypothetical protein